MFDLNDPNLPALVREALEQQPASRRDYSTWAEAARRRIRSGEDESTVLGDLLRQAELAGDALGLAEDDRNRRLAAALIGHVVSDAAAQPPPGLRVFRPEGD